MAAAVRHARIAGAAANATNADSNNYLQTAGAASHNFDRRPSFSKADDQSPAQRRKSTFKGVSSNFLSLRRMTRASMDREAAAAITAAASAKPKVRLENTYQIGPSEEQQFHYSKAEQLIREVLDSTLTGQTYDGVAASTLVSELSERIKAAVKGLNNERYKLVTNVIVGPVNEQGMVVASRCLWDTSTDTFSTVNFNNGKIFAIANVFAVYYE